MTQSESSRPAALLFDVFGTLVDWRSGLVGELHAFGERHGIVGDWAAFADAWRAAYRPSMDRVRSGEVAWKNLDELHRESLDVLLTQYGIGMNDAERNRIVHAWHALPPWPGVGRDLARLREHCIVASLSNGNVALQIDLCRHAQLSFDMLFSAELFGHYNPDAQTYLGACALLDLPPSRVMLVAAHPSDLLAAKSCGLQTAFVARPLEFGSPPIDDAVPVAAFNYSVASMEELAQVVGA